MTRKTRLMLSAAAALVGLVVATAVWLTRGESPPPDDPDTQAHATSPRPAPSEEPTDPHVAAQIRKAYQDSLAETAPPGMVELMQGPGTAPQGPNELPPLRDPFVTPARYSPSPSGDLPPLPPELAARPELLPPPDESPATNKAAPPGELPPLPPLPPLK